MFDVLDSGPQVRNLYRVVNDPETAQMLLKAHEIMQRDPTARSTSSMTRSPRPSAASVKRRAIGFEEYLKTMVDRLGPTPPDSGTSTPSCCSRSRIMESSLRRNRGAGVVAPLARRKVEG